ncbi:hypothetical protein [Acidianus manzaensis]|uniref:Uncharacterized protein n=1 Tax=Acidianus manzaensis TaxID=282676 RepID=A0A1W6JYW4_9CREN|nr:hypothetical protein [Acidianus manzaensis]ARM75459.1 hypothetical protein B6F84_05060 [Acidianus manzaensis]
MNKQIILSLVIIVIGVLLSIFTFIISSEVLYSTHVSESLGDYSSATVNIPHQYGEIKITGNINGSVNLYLLNYPTEVNLGNFSGRLDLSHIDNGYNELLFVNNQNPSSLKLTILITNTAFATAGYTLSSLALIIGVIILIYGVKLRTEKSKAYKTQHRRRK